MPRPRDEDVEHAPAAGDQGRHGRRALEWVLLLDVHAHVKNENVQWSGRGISEGGGPGAASAPAPER